MGQTNFKNPYACDIPKYNYFEALDDAWKKVYLDSIQPKGPTTFQIKSVEIPRKIIQTTCRSCHYFSDSKHSDMGICVRYPPISINSTFKQPDVSGDWYCGEHKQK
jgi:hypothetical protein